MADLPLAFLLIATAFGAALLGFGLVQAFAGNADIADVGPGATTRSDPPGVVYFFDGFDLVDATAEAMQLLSSAGPDHATAWRRFLAALAPRFPDLETQLKQLGDVGTLTVLSAVDESGKSAPVALVASRQGGLTRIHLHDGTRENRSFVTDPVTWRLLNEELEILRRVTAQMSGPAWAEDPAGQVIWANPAYLAILVKQNGDDQSLPWPLPAVFSGFRQETVDGSPERASLMISGAAQWFELRAVRQPSGGRTGYAEPIDALHRAEAALKDFVQTLSKTFSQLPIGLAVFDRNRALHMFNPALAQLTGLSVEFLAARPKLSAVLDALREANRLPEPKNYQNWRRELIEMERAATNGGYEEVWNLPDGVAFRVTGRSHPDGAIALMIEDITPEMQRSQRYHKDLALGHSVIDAVPDPVAVFNSAGELVMANPAFSALWRSDQDPDQSDTAVKIERIKDVTEQFSAITAPTNFWKQLQEYVLTIGDREAWKAQIRLSDGRLFDCQVQPVSESSTMILLRQAAVAEAKVHVSSTAKGRMRA